MKTPVELHLVLPTDVMKIFENRREKSWCYGIYNDVKARYKLSGKAQFPTVKQLSEYLNLPVEHIATRLNLN